MDPETRSKTRLRYGQHWLNKTLLKWYDYHHHQYQYHPHSPPHYHILYPNHRHHHQQQPNRSSYPMTVKVVLMTKRWRQLADLRFISRLDNCKIQYIILIVWKLYNDIINITIIFIIKIMIVIIIIITTIYLYLA